MDYNSWRKSVDKLLATQRPDLTPKDIEPNGAYQAFQAGLSPLDFVRLPAIPLRIAQLPGHAIEKEQEHMQYAQALGGNMDIGELTPMASQMNTDHAPPLCRDLAAQVQSELAEEIRAGQLIVHEHPDARKQILAKIGMSQAEFMQLVTR